MKKIFVMLIILLFFAVIGVTGLYQFAIKKPEILIRLLSVGYDEENQPFYSVIYHPEDKRKKEKVLEVIPEIVNLQESWFGKEKYFKNNLKIYILNNNDTFSKFKFNGLYVNKGNYILIKGNLNDDEFLNTLSHEFGHFFTMEYANYHNLNIENLPEWFHEGVAESFSQRIAPTPLNSKTKGYKTQPLMEIEKTHDKNGKVGYYANTYLLMQYAIEHLIYNNGEEIIANLINETKKDNDFSIAFTDLTGYDLNTYHLKFEENWRNIFAIEGQIDKGESKAGKEKLEEIIKERGYYFNEAPYVFHLLGMIYIKETRYEEAISILEKGLIYRDIPELYKLLSETATYVDKKEAIKYAKEAVKSAKRNDWDIKEYKEWEKKLSPN